MKIKVGKGYKDTAGNSWLVECRLTNPGRQKQPYVCTGLNGYHNTCYLDEDGCSAGGGIKLVPVKVKKEGWINLFRTIEGVNTVVIRPGLTIFNSRDEALDALKAVYNPTKCAAPAIKISWEEEE